MVWFMIAPIKIACALAAVLALLFVFAGQRGSTERLKLNEEPKLDDRWANDFETAVLKKTDQIIRQIDTTKTAVASPEPATVATERVLPDAPGKMPPVVLVDREERPAAHKLASAERNICTRHKMQKVWVSKYSWRCKK
jgi:hypothetical protein